MRKKPIIKWWHIPIGAILLFILLILGTCSAGVFSPIPYRYLDAFKGKVIDAENKEPIDGAVVLAIYFKETYTIAGSNSWAVDGQEVLTDGNGEFEIRRKRRWLALYRGYTEGNLTIFKPGYGVFPRHKNSKAVGENKTWPPSDKYVVYELPKLATKEERVRTVLDIDIEYDMQFSRQKIMIQNVNEEFKDLGLKDRYIEKDGKPILTLVR